MDEQVVPTFAPARPPLKRCPTVPANLPALVPKSSPLQPPSPPKLSPAPEFPGKLRWETPLRASRHYEHWQGARELGIDHAVRSKVAAGVSTVARSAVAEVVVAYVGAGLPKDTVRKWLCLLCEYLELNADEVVLVVCLLRRYVRKGGKFVGKGDWARPQRWECVVAVACYLAVLLTEEFPGRTAMDLKELLGPNFKFGREQISFLKVVDWRISITGEVFKEVKEAVEGMMRREEEARKAINEWFMVDEAVLERERQAAEEAAAAAAAVAAMAPSPQQQIPVAAGKKRGYAAIAPADDSVVPRIVVPRIEAVHSVPAAFIRTVPAVPHWAMHPW